MRGLFIFALALVLVALSSAASPAQPLRLRINVGPNQLGCGPLPQVKDDDRHTDNVKANHKKHDGTGMTRSHSFTIPDVTHQR